MFKNDNEFAEFGAVKINEEFKTIGEFARIVKPRVYKKLQHNIKKMLNYDEKLLAKGDSFLNVCSDFLKWCGEEYIFCTWGNLDLMQLQTNMEFYHMGKLKVPLKYFDIQKIYADIYTEDKKIVSLEKAILNLKIPVNDLFHTAIYDARYTAEVLRKMEIKDFDDRYCLDYYNHPSCKEEEIICHHKEYNEYVTREFRNKVEAFKDKDVAVLRCSVCGRKLIKKEKWFASNSNLYYSLGKCIKHGFVLGTIKFKQTQSEKYFIIKKEDLVSKAIYDKIKNRHEVIEKKKKLLKENKKAEEKKLENKNPEKIY